MKRNLAAVLVLGLFCAGYLMFIAGLASQMPERVAMHFGLGGRADNWMDRQSVLIFFGALGVGMPVLFVLLATLTAWIPVQFVNLPHRDYWLAPERRAETVAIISRQMIWMGCWMIVFLAGIYYLTIQANRVTPPQLPMVAFLVMTGGFLVGVVVWSIAFIRRFSKVP